MLFKKTIRFSIICVFYLGIILLSCQVDSKEKDAKKFIKLSCELVKMAREYDAHDLLIINEFESKRKAFDEHIRKVKSKYETDEDLEKFMKACEIALSKGQCTENDLEFLEYFIDKLDRD
jgi:hypothetical protein